MGKTSSQDRCASSDSLDNISYGKHGDNINPDSFLCLPKTSINPSQPEINFPLAYADPSHGAALFAVYGLNPTIQPEVMGSSSSRVPLPVNLSDDGPIYVNAKQYHGILRRRQVRARLEAQNKLVKSRKPYLHESRHMHAVNRVRGSGGRFLSKKNSHQSDSLRVSEGMSGAVFRQPVEEGLFSGIQTHMPTSIQGSGGGLVYNGNRHYVSIVR